MIRIAHVSDTHADEFSRLAEHDRIMAWIGEEIRRREVDLTIHTGDVWERKSSSRERASVGDYVRNYTEHAPLILVGGNHDDLLDVVWLGKLRTKHQVRAFDRPAAFEIEVQAGPVAMAVLPWPQRGQLLATIGRPVSDEEAGQVAQECLRNVILGLGVELDRFRGPRILATHAMIDGAKTDHDQPIIGAQMAVSVSDLGHARADFVAVGHIHAQNHWTWNDAPVVYAGAPRHCNFGEPGPKGFVIADFDETTGKCIHWERVATPCTPMLLLEFDYQPGAEPVPLQGDPVGAEVRLRFSFESDHRDAAKGAAERIKSMLLDAGAVSVKLDPQARSTTRARVPEISAAKDLKSKLFAWTDSRGMVIENDRRARLSAKVDELEEESAA